MTSCGSEAQQPTKRNTMDYKTFLNYARVRLLEEHPNDDCEMFTRLIDDLGIEYYKRPVIMLNRKKGYIPFLAVVINGKTVLIDFGYRGEVDKEDMMKKARDLHSKGYLYYVVPNNLFVDDENSMFALLNWIKD